VVRFTDELRAVCDEAVRSGALPDILWALDYFDASINRVAAWVIGARALRKALLYAMLEPFEAIAEREEGGIGAAKLALVEHRAELAFPAVWDHLCLAADVPLGPSWLRDVAAYEVKVRAQRG
jgi:L-rhamnose isomerase